MWPKCLGYVNNSVYDIIINNQFLFPEQKLKGLVIISIHNLPTLLFLLETKFCFEDKLFLYLNKNVMIKKIPE